MHNLAKTALLLCAIGSGAALWAQPANLGILRDLHPGKWTITARDGVPPRTICLRDPAQLVQLRHRGPACSRYLVDSTPDKVTVQYTCRGSGYGLTTVRRETPELVQIESQGIYAKRPFQFRAEARRVGSCR